MNPFKTVLNSVDFGTRLLKAIGIKDALPWDRIVIVADVNDGVPRIYVRGIAPETLLPALAQAVADVAVNDNGDVSAAPFAEEIKGE